MSKLIDAIVAKPTEQRKMLSDNVLLGSLLKIDDGVSHDALRCATKYRVSVTLGAESYIDDSKLNSNIDELQLAIDQTKRMIIEAIFGEFRADILQLEHSINDRDYVGARNLIWELHKKMFEV